MKGTEDVGEGYRMGQNEGSQWRILYQGPGTSLRP